MTRAIVAVVSAVLGMGACGDGQAGDDYRGEPLMSLNGVVTSVGAALSSDQVPALLLGTAFDPAVDGARTIYFVQGQVEGMFPASFTLRVYDEPPQGVASMAFAGEPPMIWGVIVAISSDHPAWLRRREFVEQTDVGDKQRDQVCDDRGTCIEGYPSDCPAGLLDPASDWPCGGGIPGLPWEVYGFSVKHRVAYLAAPAAAGGLLSKLYAGGAAISAGYHVVEEQELSETLTPEAFAANQACMDAAVTEATAEVMRRHGVTENQIQPDFTDEWQELNVRGYAEMGCNIGSRIVTSTAAVPVTLPFTTAPTPFGI